MTIKTQIKWKENKKIQKRKKKICRLHKIQIGSLWSIHRTVGFTQNIRLNDLDFFSMSQTNSKNN